jgi:hypothetical protein
MALVGKIQLEAVSLKGQATTVEVNGSDDAQVSLNTADGQIALILWIDQAGNLMFRCSYNHGMGRFVFKTNGTTALWGPSEDDESPEREK